MVLVGQEMLSPAWIRAAMITAPSMRLKLEEYIWIGRSQGAQTDWWKAEGTVSAFE
jgi:predicted RNA-binding Zn ribbon-like protein